MCQYCSGHFLSTMKKSQKEFEKRRRTILCWLSGSKVVAKCARPKIKTICCPLIHLFTMAHSIMKNSPSNGNIPKVLTELLQRVVFKMTDHGPHYSSVINGDNQNWKIQCSKYHKYMSEVECDLPVFFAICPLIVLLHNGLVHLFVLDLTLFDENVFHRSALVYLFSSFEAYSQNTHWTVC